MQFLFPPIFLGWAVFLCYSLLSTKVLQCVYVVLCVLLQLNSQAGPGQVLLIDYSDTFSLL